MLSRCCCCWYPLSRYLCSRPSRASYRSRSRSSLLCVLRSLWRLRLRSWLLLLLRLLWRLVVVDHQEWICGMWICEFVWNVNVWIFCEFFVNLCGICGMCECVECVWISCVNSLCASLMVTIPASLSARRARTRTRVRWRASASAAMLSAARISTPTSLSTLISSATVIISGNHENNNGCNYNCSNGGKSVYSLC